ncbi:hypothetical protein pb186bvf_003961 [Paramecium bursaria]
MKNEKQNQKDEMKQENLSQNDRQQVQEEKKQQLSSDNFENTNKSSISKHIIKDQNENSSKVKDEQKQELFQQFVIEDYNPKIFTILQYFINTECPYIQRIYDLERRQDGNIKCLYKVQKPHPNSLSFNKWILSAQQLDLTHYLFQLIEGCKFFYENKIYYREIKQSNIIVSDCLQFAFSQKSAIFDPEGDYYEYKHYEKLPMPYNSAPEIFFNDSVNPQSDVFSLGIIFHIMIYKAHPFDTSSQSKYKEDLKRIQNKPFQCNQSVQINLHYCNIIERMLIYDPKHRINWQELFDEFDKLKNKIQQKPKDQDQQEKDVIKYNILQLEARQFPIIKSFNNIEDTVGILYRKIKELENNPDPVICLLYHLVCYKGLIIANDQDIWRWNVKIINSRKFLQEAYSSNGIIQHFIRKVDECSISKNKIDAFIEFVSHLKSLSTN